MYMEMSNINEDKDDNWNRLPVSIKRPFSPPKRGAHGAMPPGHVIEAEFYTDRSFSLPFHTQTS